MTHDELVRAEWDVRCLLDGTIRFAKDDAARNLRNAGAVLSAVRSAGQWLCDPTTSEEIRQQVLDSLCAALFNQRDGAGVDAFTAMRADAERWQWWCANAKERLLDVRRAQSEIAPDMRTHWVGPVLICSGPVGGHMTPSEAIDAARSKT